ncbi:MAG: isoprenylcysteine carboxylmethyltransferase family protein [Syntrophaceae bacterium]
MSTLLHFSKKNRLNISRVLIGSLILLDFLSTPHWPMKPGTLILIEFLAFILVMIATFGRLWSLSYISGNKSQNLITNGPYSLMRNPLYFFSLIGAIGLGIVSKSMFIFSVILVAFAVYYPLVVRAEEEHLERIHDDDFRRYKDAVPMFLPSFSNYQEEPSFSVDARRLRRSFFSAVWFPLIFFIMITVDRLQALQIMHPIFIIR